LQTLTNKKQIINERISYLHRTVRSLIHQDAHYETIGDVKAEIHSKITEGTWVEKEIVRLSKQINELRKRQGFTKVARAFMTSTTNFDDAFHVTNSIIQINASEDILQTDNNIPHYATDDPQYVTNNPYDNVLYYDNSELQQDNQKLRTATAQLQEELAKIKEELTQIYVNLNNAEPTPQTPRTTTYKTTSTSQPTASPKEIEDLLSSINVMSKPQDTQPSHHIAEDNVIQAKLAKELIKLANSYKIQELTFDVQASKRRFNFSTWFSKMQTILSLFPQTACVIQQDGTIRFYDNNNDLGNKALFLLIGTKVDTYFQRAIRHFSGQGYKALVFIQTQCANISLEDKAHFHHAFITLRIKENESATAFIRRFIFAKTEAEAVGKTYSEQELVSFVLTGLNFSKNSKYDTALQLYRL